jgi:hypothetical protein
MVSHDLKSGDLVFVQRQNADDGLLLEMTGIAHFLNRGTIVHVRSVSGQVSFPVGMIHSTTREASTGKIWVYLK